MVLIWTGLKFSIWYRDILLYVCRPSTVLTFQALSEDDRKLWMDVMDGKEPVSFVDVPVVHIFCCFIKNGVKQSCLSFIFISNMFEACFVKRWLNVPTKSL